MLLRELRNLFHKELEHLYPATEIDSILDILLEHYQGVGRFVLALQPQYTLSKEEANPFFEALARLTEEEPVQYITGTEHFFGLDFKVNPNVLIPRPETEELVRWILEDQKDKEEKINILDVGTGSGNIAISLAKQLPEAEVHALDISEEALETARSNARDNEVNVHFIQDDIKRLKSLDITIDVLVSNPPYVRLSESRLMKNNVTKYEPWGALFVPDEAPLMFYESLARFGKNNLADGGAIYLEINQYLGDDLLQLLRDEGYTDLELKSDLFGKDRMVKGVLRKKLL